MNGDEVAIRVGCVVMEDQKMQCREVIDQSSNPISQGKSEGKEG